MLRRKLLPYLLIGLLFPAFAQSQNTAAMIRKILAADSMASGNFKDVLTSFFQFSMNQITSPNKEFNFASNPYAVLLKANPNAAIDTNYVKYKTLRKLNFNFGLKLDSSFRFNGFSSGIRYAIINKRDSTTSRFLFSNLGTDSLSIEKNILQDSLVTIINRRFPNTPENFEKRRTLIQDANDFFTNETKTFDQYDAGFRDLVIELADTIGLYRISHMAKNMKKFNLKKESDKHFTELKQELQNKLLWTFSIADTTYQDQFMFSNIVVQSELLKGLGKAKPGSNWEFNLLTSLNITDDIQRDGRDLGRAVFRFDPAINWVFRNRDGGASMFEFKMGGRYQHFFKGMYTGEKRNELVMNAVFRVKIINDIWLPLDITYDPANGNILGLISARFNFSTFGKKI